MCALEGTGPFAHWDWRAVAGAEAPRDTFSPQTWRQPQPWAEPQRPEPRLAACALQGSGTPGRAAAAGIRPSGSAPPLCRRLPITGASSVQQPRPLRRSPKCAARPPAAEACARSIGRAVHRSQRSSRSEPPRRRSGPRCSQPAKPQALLERVDRSPLVGTTRAWDWAGAQAVPACVRSAPGVSQLGRSLNRFHLELNTLGTFMSPSPRLSQQEGEEISAGLPAVARQGGKGARATPPEPRTAPAAPARRVLVPSPFLSRP